MGQHKLEAASSDIQSVLRKEETVNFIELFDMAADKLAPDEVKFTYYAALRHLDYPTDWRDANTKGALERVIAWAKARIAPPAER